MKSSADRNGLDILERMECSRLLPEAAVGRLAYVHDGIPAAVPVNLALTDDQMLFRLGTGGAPAATSPLTG